MVKSVIALLPESMSTGFKLFNSFFVDPGPV